MAKKKLLTRREPLASRQKELALTVLMRDKLAFEQVKDSLTAYVWDSQGDRGYAILWKFLQDFYTKHGRLPGEEVTYAELEARLNDDPNIGNADVEALSEFLDVAFKTADKELDRDVALGYVQQLMEEQLQREAADTLASGVIVELPAMFEAYQSRSDAIAALKTEDVPLPFPDSPEKIKPVILEPTGIGCLDVYMCGGMAKKEVNGFCGPFGSCKTLLGIMLAVEAARQELEIWRRMGSQGLPRRVYFVSYEEDQEQLGQRALSFAAGIRRDSLIGGDYLAQLSRTGNLKQYERDLFNRKIALGVEPEGEFERMKNAMAELNHSLRFLDFSGSTEQYRSVAGDLAGGIASVIEKDQIRYGRPGVSLVVCDYIGAAVERAIGQGKAKREETRHYVGRFPLNLKNLVAVPMDCKVWALHQLNADANSREAGIAPKVTDTAEAKNVFENVSFGFMVGKPTRDGLVVLTNGKQRRAAKRDDIVIRIDGALSRIIDVSKYFCVQNRTIVDRDNANMVVDIPGMEQGTATRIRKDNLFGDVDANQQRDIGI